MKISKKIIIGVIAVIAIVAVIASIYWFSMPSEQRNMVLFMMVNGENYEDYESYQVIDRNANSLTPDTFEPSNQSDVNNSHVVAITEMVQNEDSKMLKKGMVQTEGQKDYTGWHVIADEGADEGDYPFGPSPLSYYTSGLASNLHTQILRAAEQKGVTLDSVKVEVLNTFRWDDMMSDEGAGFLDLSSTTIIIESNESDETIEEIKELALNSWTAGEALRNETVIEPTLVTSGNNWHTYNARPATSESEISFVDSLKITSVSDIAVHPTYLQESTAEEAIGFDSMSNLQFEIYAIAESAGNSDRPYLTEITLSTPSQETWVIYSDEFMGENDHPLAPTSLEYFTVGTSLCLTSQTTLVSAMMGLDYTDYRVEQEIDYRFENPGTLDMAGFTDTVHSYVLIESDESEERLETFYNKALALCFAGEGLKNVTDMTTRLYLNGQEIK